ncbi:MAG: protein-L-isoaspartate O-methyltransferase family protein [Rhizobiaceae bacterium]
MHPDFQALRVKMVDGQLRTTDVTSHEVLSAFLSVPRELFVGEAYRSLAYLDDDIEIAPGRYLMEPSPLGKLLQLAAIGPGDKVLIVGAGSGYSSAIVAHIAGQVFGLEQDETLLALAKSNIATLQLSNVEFVSGALEAGAASKGPFNVILIEGSVSKVPSTLVDQLAEGGRLVAVEGQGLTGVASSHIKSGKTTAASRAFNLAVKPLPGFQSAAAFVF